MKRNKPWQWDKKVTLFNKNHITVTKIDNGKGFRQLNKSKIDRYGEDSVFRIERTAFAAGSPNSAWNSPRKPRYHESHGRKIMLPDYYILKESPLGFYYSYPVSHPAERGEQPKDSRSGITWRFTFPDVTYEITYLTKAEDKQTQIDNDTRPWQLVDGSMDDHFIFDLLTEVTKICDRAKEEKLQCYERYSYYNYRWSEDKDKPMYDAHEAKRQIFLNLFGNSDGPKFQTNEEKILSHGFDLVTSFRKM